MITWVMLCEAGLSPERIVDDESLSLSCGLREAFGKEGEEDGSKHSPMMAFAHHLLLRLLPPVLARG